MKPPEGFPFAFFCHHLSLCNTSPRREVSIGSHCELAVKLPEGGLLFHFHKFNVLFGKCHLPFICQLCVCNKASIPSRPRNSRTPILPILFLSQRKIADSLHESIAFISASPSLESTSPRLSVLHLCMRKSTYSHNNFLLLFFL